MSSSPSISDFVILVLLSVIQMTCEIPFLGVSMKILRLRLISTNIALVLFVVISARWKMDVTE
jgi:hypothetical protein